MPQDTVVEIPGVGSVTFPASMSSDQINAAAKRLHDEANGPESKSVGGFIGNAIPSAFNAVMALPKAAAGMLGLTSPMSMGEGIKQRYGQEARHDDSPSPTPFKDASRAVAAHYVDRYRPGNIGNTLYTDPFGALNDAATIALPMAGGALKATQIPRLVNAGTTAAEWGNKLDLPGRVMTGTAQAVKKAADTVVPPALQHLMPGLAKRSDDFGDLTPFARQQQTPIGGSKIQSDLSKVQSKNVDYLLGLRDESRPQVAGYLPPGRVVVPLGKAPVPTGGAPAVTEAERILRRVEHPAVPGPDRSGVDALVQTQTQLGGAHPALPKQRLGFSDNDIRLAESLGEQTRPVPSHVLLGPGRPAGTHFEPQFTGEILPSAGRADVVAGPGSVRLPLAPSHSGGWRPGMGAGEQMVDPAEILTGLKKARAKVAARSDRLSAGADLEGRAQEFLEGRPGPMTLLETKQLARAENNLAHNANIATAQGTPKQDVPALFHQGMGGQANTVVRGRAPEIIPYDKLAEQHLGLSRVLYDAQEAAKLHPPSIRPSSWVTPRMMSKGVYKADNAATAIAQRLRATAPTAGRSVLLARLADILAQNGAGGRTGGSQ